MKNIKTKLSTQLFCLIIIVFVIIFIALVIVLPRVLMPVAEENIYNYLRQPLEVIQSSPDKLSETEVAYIYLTSDGVIMNSANLIDIIPIKNTTNILKKIKNEYGKFYYNNKVYYYYTVRKDSVIKIALSDDSYITKINSLILEAIVPIVLSTFVIISLILIVWSSFIVHKIEKLKSKIDHLEDDDYNHNIDFDVDDEIKSLALAIEDLRQGLKVQDEYRNQMYQNISHDFKTPLTVIKSYIEAVHDKVENEDTAIKVIGEQADKLEQKVHSLLYLNKLDCLKDSKDIKIVEVNIIDILQKEIEKFKFQNKNITFILDTDKKVKYYGTYDHWETIFDNLFGNFMRYAKTTIKITVKSNRIILYNDGPPIDDELLDCIFTPFRKGIKGQFGLGLSIVKKTLNIINYDISIKNTKKGVIFTIKGIHK